MRKRFICAALLLALHCGFAHAQPPPPDPEVAINSCTELQTINNYLAGNYYLANDIDCAGFDSGDGKGFMPLGNADTPFTGTFDGQGFTISNVFINRPDQDYYVGLFGFAGRQDGAVNVKISHLTLTGLDITGNSHVGGLFGQLYYGTVTDVHSEGYVQGVAALGGLGGDARYSTITNVSSSGSVDGYHGGDLSRIFYGGLLGGNEKTELSCSSSDANVVGNYRVGGLVGHNSGTVSSSFATGMVQGLYRVGGLAGENVSGTISDCFARGDVSGFSGSHELGGLVGLQCDSAVIRNSYAIGSVTGGTTNMNGVLGLLYNSSVCADNYWDVTASGVSTDGCGSGGRTTAEMQTQSTFGGWDFDAVWTMNGYPELQCVSTSSDQHTVTPSAGTGGSISPDTSQSVNHGATVSFTVLADAGYVIDIVEGCGGSLSGNIYTTAPITDDCEVTASFTPHADRNGMTWGVNRYNSDLNITRVHCYGQVGPNRGPCNPYQGDTSCSDKLPVLCVKVDGRPRPPYALATCSTCAMNDEYYNGWAEGIIGLTAPVQGDAFATLDDVNAYCEEQLGLGYRVAEHHDGRLIYGMDENNFYGATWPLTTSSGGWGFYAPGQLADDSRFWVHINDQNANCWGSNAEPKGSIGDQVWADPDEDGNGLLDGDDYPLAGVNMRLYDSGGNLVRETETYVNGKYLFSNIDYGTYSVEIDQTSLPSNMQGNAAYAPAASVTIDASSPNNNGQDFAVYVSAEPRDGMTWGVASHDDSDLDISRVHCYGQPGSPCDPSHGDTSCFSPLPVLCVKVDGRPRPSYSIPVCGSSCSMNDEFYNGWIEGSAELTAPIQGNAFATLDDVNSYCEAQLGPGYRAAEFHDGRWVYGMDENNFYGSTWPENTYAGGWGFYAPGQLADDSRFWVDINDQNANCWSRTAVTTWSLSVNSSGASDVAITSSPSAYSGTTNYSKTGIPSGTVITLTAPAAGSASTTFSSWDGCDSTDPAVRTCTVTMSADKTVTAHFVTNIYTVTPSAGAGGSISPNTPQSVEHGKTTDFEVTPATGYSIDKVEGCGGTLSGSTYTTGAITADCTVTATFAAVGPMRTVIPRARRHGSITPAAPQQVPQGTTVSFTVTPDQGYTIKSVSGCRGSLNGDVYTTGPVRRDCTVTASFRKLRNYSVRTETGRHGSITPHKRQRVQEGSRVSFTVIPDAGYAIKRVRGCRGSLNGDVYTTGPMRRDCTVKAAFKRD